MTADPAEAFAERIQAMAPEVAVRTAVYNGEGLINDVVIVNDHLVFRFAKGERGLASLAGELEVLSAIRPALGARALAIPNPFYTSRDAIAYELVRGQPLSRGQLLKLDDAAQQAVAGQLGDFLRDLHSAPAAGPLSATRAYAHRAEWTELRRSTEALIYPLLMGYQRDWLRDLFEHMLDDPGRLAYEPRLIHGDLWPEHILFDPATGRLSGIIDFGMAGLGDPATDLGNLLQVYGETFVARLFGRYPEAAGMMERARFFAEMHELEWTLRGLTSGDTFWFTAHLGNARDLGLNG